MVGGFMGVAFVRHLSEVTLSKRIYIESWDIKLPIGDMRV